MRRLLASRRTWWQSAVAVIDSIIIATACGSGGTANGSAPSSAPATASSGPLTASASSPATASVSPVCQDVAALRGSLAKLTHVTVAKGAAATLASDARDVQAKVTTLAHDAGSQWSARIGTLKSALSTLQTAVTGLGHGGSLGSVSSALGGVKTAAQDLLAAAGAQCPSPSASPSSSP